MYLDQLRKQIAEFENASGIKIDDWDLGNIGKTVRALRDVHPARLREKYEGLRRQMAVIVNGLETAVGAMDDLEMQKAPARASMARTGAVINY